MAPDHVDDAPLGGADPLAGLPAAAGPTAGLDDAFLRACEDELAGRVSPRRLAHVRGVAQTARRLARRYGVDERAAYAAGLLHDWDKGYDDEGIRARARDLGLDARLDPWVIEHMPQVLHAHTAAAALGRAYPQIPAKVLQAIDRHTVAAPDMAPLDMVTYVADALEPGRRFGRIDELRAAEERLDLDELFLATYEYWVTLLLERRRPVHPDTIRIWNECVARRAARKEEDRD